MVVGLLLEGCLLLRLEISAKGEWIRCGLHGLSHVIQLVGELGAYLAVAAVADRAREWV